MTSLNCGSLLVLGRDFGLSLLMKLPEHWVLLGVLLCQCFMPSLGVIQCLILEGRVKRLHGTPGTHIVMFPQHSVPWFPDQPYKP